ncbi:MAG TPA: bifunctional UDP-N-acetylglucosamine diphosphorylase/glucosamine-1-phosphate N-acetyltransferase GlmU [Anaerolineales bacterium]|nr:bifunctional UDP-N-acetylglucosamine diphosphorylase/glucosamine-1-phosphate N-acetyltransferase GlmU [Anaerolineales bacterium]
MKVSAVILAAGQGTRMHSSTPKVLHPLLGRPLVQYALDAVNAVTAEPPVLVIGHGADQIRQMVGSQAEFALQEPQLGTGHAVQMAAPFLRGRSDLLLVTLADMPLVRPQTLRALLDAHQTASGPMTMTVVKSADPRGFGRVVRTPDGGVAAIVEEAQATAEHLQINELNASIYCFNAEWLWSALERIPLSPKGEYYLTDLAAIAAAEGSPAQAFVLADVDEGIGINTRVHLAEAEAILRGWINRDWMLRGVSLVDPASTFIEPGVTIGEDTVIWPNTYLQGDTHIGGNCAIGPNSIIRNTRIGDRCTVLASVCEKAVLEEDVQVGPFARLRSGAHLARGVHMGNFGEVKNSYLGPGVKMGHFSYLGDATLGPDVNVGAGTITCNFDGEKKHPTKVGAGVFIGSDTMLVAPLNLGDGARTGAGAVVTKDVPPGTLVVGMPARPIRRLEKRDG